MEPAKIGNTVRIHYTCMLDDGVVIDSSRERDPLEFTIGSGQVISGCEKAVVGMNVGDIKTIRIPASEAYGDYREDLVINLDKSQFPEDIEPVEGLHLHLRSPDGHILNAVITRVDDNSVTLDANHPLAGKDLTFEIELIEIIQ